MPALEQAQPFLRSRCESSHVALMRLAHKIDMRAVQVVLYEPAQPHDVQPAMDTIRRSRQLSCGLVQASESACQLRSVSALDRSLRRQSRDQRKHGVRPLELAYGLLVPTT